MKTFNETNGIVMILLGVFLFIVSSSQAALPLTADPILDYSTFLGGSGEEYQDQQNLAVDGAGNAIITGRFMGDWCSNSNTCFPVTPGAYDTQYDNGDHFIAKLSADGSMLLFATYFPAELKGITVDADGKIYVVGVAGAGFRVTPGAYQGTYGGGVNDVVLARLSSSGSLEYATYLGGSGSDGDLWTRITLGSDGSVYVTGNTTSSNFLTTPGAYSRSLNGGSDVFISRLRLNSQGSQDLLYSTFIGGSDEESGFIAGVAVDAFGNIYVAGQTSSTDFPVKNPDPFFNGLCPDTIVNGANVSNAFMAKLAPQGNGLEDLMYSTYLKCAGVPWVLAGDTSGNLYMTGFTVSSNFPTTNQAYDRTHNGGEEIWAIKLNPAGKVIYSTFIGGETTAQAFDHGHGIAADSAGNTYIVGTTISPLFSITANGFDTTFSGSGDAYLVKLSPDGSDLLYGTFLGGSMTTEETMNVVVKEPGLVYVSGFTSSLEGCNEFDPGCTGAYKFPTTSGAYKEIADPINDGVYELFVAKFNLSDLDADGLPDNWEIQYGLNPGDPTGNNGASGDPDIDGFTNLQEYQGESNPQNPTSVPPYKFSNLTNISTRAFVQTGDNVAIGGFVINGPESKTVLIRGRGPSMGGAPFNVPGVLSDPTMELYSGSTVIAQNNNWQTTEPLCSSPAIACGGATQITATGKDPCQPFPGQTSPPQGCTLESAILITLPPGGYTAIVRGVGGGTGAGLVEVFEVGTSTSRLINISTRARVETGPNVAIGGFIIGGVGPKTVLIRARGPSMSGAPFFVPGVLSNPMVQLYSGTTVIAQNDNWQTTEPQCDSPAISCGGAVQITATGKDPCQPFPGQLSAPQGCSQESAILVTLPPGGYTAIVSGVGGGTGIGLVEVFETSP